MAVNESNVSAIQLGDYRCEYHKPDLAVAYSIVAPLIAEAYAYLRCDKIMQATDCVKRAKAVIDQAETQATVVIAELPPSQDK
jgi:hypothetical protein